MVAAYTMIACGLASVIASSVLPIAAVPSHTTCMPTAIAATAAMTAAATTTFGIGGTNR